MTSPTCSDILTQVSSLIRLLERQLDLFEQLHALSDQQRALVAEGSSEALLGLLAQRQLLIDQLAEINQQLGPYRQHWQHLWEGLEPAQRDRISPLVRKAQELLEGIMRQDEQDRQKIVTAKAQVGAQLHQIAQTGAAINAYGSPYQAEKPGRFTNHQG